MFAEVSTVTTDDIPQVILRASGGTKEVPTNLEAGRPAGIISFEPFLNGAWQSPVMIVTTVEDAGRNPIPPHAPLFGLGLAFHNPTGIAVFELHPDGTVRIGCKTLQLSLPGQKAGDTLVCTGPQSWALQHNP